MTTPELITLPMMEPDYIQLFDFERNFDISYWRKTIRDNWVIAAYASAIYLVLVLVGVQLMKNRKPFKLNKILIVWNIGLSVMSICACCRMSMELLHHLSSNGFHNTVCEWYVLLSIKIKQPLLLISSKETP